MSYMHAAVQEFNRAVGAVTGDTPDIRDAELRARLILEEATETIVAMLGNERAYDLVSDAADQLYHPLVRHTATNTPDLVEAVDGLMDLLYVTFGALDAFGINPTLAACLFDVVHAANMTKANAPKDVNGKVQKPAGFVPPQDTIRALLRKAGWRG